MNLALDQSDEVATLRKSAGHGGKKNRARHFLITQEFVYGTDIFSIILSGNN